MVETFKGAMPIVTALRAPELTESHWNDINNLIDGTINVEEEGFTLQRKHWFFSTGFIQLQRYCSFGVNIAKHWGMTLLPECFRDANEM